MAPARIIEISAGPDRDAPIPAHDAHHENEWYNKDFDGYRITEQPLHAKKHIRMICVGAGAAGLQIAYKAERLLENVELQIYDKNHDIGGTWLENRYPGCTCDIPSHSYQFTWEKNPNWSQFYSSSEEIWKYFKHVATKYDLEKYIKLNTKVQSARWDEGAGKWRLILIAADGTQFEDECEILVNGSGVLNKPKYPNIPGMNEFGGKIMHSGAWDGNYDLAGKTVAVIGGGSSAVQIIPNIQPGFGAKYAGPGGTNFKYSEEQLEEFRKDPAKLAKYSRDIEGELNKRFTLMHRTSHDQKNSRELIADIMREQLDNDPLLTKKMIPGFDLGCRRMTPGSGYLQSLKKENVQVVPESVVRFTKDGVVDESGIEHKADVVVCASGFDVGFTPHFETIGRNEANIKEQFGEDPKAYLAITAPNFPNLFLFIGPNGPASHSSILPIMEWHTRYLFQMVEKLQTENIKAFAPKKEACEELYQHTHELMKRLVWSSACSSWFKMGKKHGPVTAIYPGSRLHYFEMLKNVRYEDYDITYRTKNRFQFMGNGYTQCELSVDGDPVWYFDDPFVRV
ncbi:sterigmatocystin biosynthesis monooxygenase stcW [Hyphodiscus hymeniophilus]|uniref:Sterigmatocystin biosynthesis monooxygenase stcW n=1 Tax=Hyphodiscus hymeniophilus TaxID=353542 RepID=A0A9P6VJI0_9HELO|nr:sterigmatocystin biosynthesis monooxygenase stcW [Hyphodiscus hymeniophilus]